MKVEIDFETAWELKMRLESDIDNIKNGRDFGDIDRLRKLSSELDYVEVPTTSGSVYVSDYQKFVPYTHVASYKLFSLGFVPVRAFKDKWIYYSYKTGKAYIVD